MEESGDEESDSVYWNNWLPSVHSKEKTCSDENKATKKFSTRVVFSFPNTTSVLQHMNNSECGHWIPPVNFFNNIGSDKTLSKAKQKRSQRESLIFNNSGDISKENLEVSQKSYKCCKSITWKKEINLDWGKRRELHDATKFNDGDIVWGIVNLGLFGNIKVWVNEYGNICGLAEGKISKLYSPEITLISISNTQLLRKMLGLSGAQWASICESLQESKTTLKFNALQDCDMNKTTNLEKLWIFICKRRHFLPDQCMQVKLCGAVKCMKKFQIIPKLLVQDIRNIQGEPIL